MKSVPCPHDDGGICTIPDKTAVVTGGVVSIYSREEIESVYPDIDLRRDSLRPLAPMERNLIEAVDRVSSVVKRDEALATSALNETAAATAVIVNCSCSHLFVADV